MDLFTAEARPRRWICVHPPYDVDLPSKKADAALKSPSKVEPRTSEARHHNPSNIMSGTEKPKVAFLGPEASYTHQVSQQSHCVASQSSAMFLFTKLSQKVITSRGPRSTSYENDYT